MMSGLSDNQSGWYRRSDFKLLSHFPNGKRGQKLFLCVSFEPRTPENIRTRVLARSGLNVFRGMRRMPHQDEQRQLRRLKWRRRATHGQDEQRQLRRLKWKRTNVPHESKIINGGMKDEKRNSKADSKLCRQI